jgi:hypothetical protein
VNKTGTKKDKNKRHFEERNGVCSMFKILSAYICLKKYIKCNIWRVAIRPSYIKDAGFLRVKRKGMV